MPCCISKAISDHLTLLIYVSDRSKFKYEKKMLGTSASRPIKIDIGRPPQSPASPLVSPPLPGSCSSNPIEIPPPGDCASRPIVLDDEEKTVISSISIDVKLDESLLSNRPKIYIASTSKLQPQGLLRIHSKFRVINKRQMW